MNRIYRLIHALLPALAFSFLLFNFALGQYAPAGPGKDAQWASAGKQAVGTANSLDSKVWFTLQSGVMTEVYYPNVAVANVHMLQFIVVDPLAKTVETEFDDAIHEIRALRPDSLSFQQINTAKSGKWKITKTYVSDPKSDTVWIKVGFEPKVTALKLYIYYDPSLANSGMHDSGSGHFTRISPEKSKGLPGDGKERVRTGNARVLSGFVSTDTKVASYLWVSKPLSEVSNGYYGTSDGLDQLRRSGELHDRYSKAEDGNVVQIARVMGPESFSVVLSFGQNAEEAISSGSSSIAAAGKGGFDMIRAPYDKGWADYVRTLPKIDPKYQAQFNMAAMQLKVNEDKTYRGANIASMTVPWGGGATANEDNVGGYHLVWSRDLYQVFTAYLALGDRGAAERALDFLLNVQQKPDGSFPQNSWLDGKPFWGSLQMDEVAYPLIMAWQLGKTDKETYENHLKKAADFIVRNGPKTPQERWEEEGGYSPSTIAAEIAGLVCAADIARKNGDEASALVYQGAADDWARKVEMWTATTTGKHGDGNYYVRITQNGNPDAGDKIELNNGAGFFDERDIVDAGFLELVRLGIKPADDPLIAKSVKVIDDVIKVETPNGPAFYRYNHDGYGEMDDGRRWNWDGKYTGKGRLWVLLSGERGQYELALASAGGRRQETGDRGSDVGTGLVPARDGESVPGAVATGKTEKVPAKAQSRKEAQGLSKRSFQSSTNNYQPLSLRSWQAGLPALQSNRSQYSFLSTQYSSPGSLRSWQAGLPAIQSYGSDYLTSELSRPSMPQLSTINYQTTSQSSVLSPQYSAAQRRLDDMLAFANEGLMIPEQVWDKQETPENIDRQFVPELKFGEGTGSATPLAWSMAQFIRLAVNIKEGRNLDTPQVVYDRYVKGGIPGNATNFGGMGEEFNLPVKAGEKFSFTRDAPKGTKIGYNYGGKVHFIEVGDDGKFTVEVIAPEGQETVVVGIEVPGGATAFERVKVRSADKAEPEKIDTIVAETIKKVSRSPVIVGSNAYVFYKGEAKSVMFAGDNTSWAPRKALQKIGNGVFALRLDLSDDSRLEYKLVVDGKWLLDPANTKSNSNGVGGENSVIEMPGYRPSELAKQDLLEPTAHSINEMEIDSKKYGKRMVKIYLPSEYFRRGIAPKLPVVYFLDGSDYLNRAKAVTVAEKLIAAGKVKPFMMVFTDPVDRMKEYWASDEYADYIAKEVIPSVENKYFNVLEKGRANRSIIGASLGGITSIWTALRHPDLFRNVGAQSASFWVDDERVIGKLKQLDAEKGDDFNFYVDDGVFEGAEDSRRVNVMLRGKGFRAKFVERSTGHNWTSWRDRLAEAFVALMN